MLILVTYDVETLSMQGQTRLRKVAQICQNYGQRVQNSVFECIVDYTQFIKLKIALKEAIDEKHDSIRLYNLGNNYTNKVETFGICLGYNMAEELIL